MAFNVDLYKNFKVEEKYKIFLGVHPEPGSNSSFNLFYSVA